MHSFIKFSQPYKVGILIRLFTDKGTDILKG